MPKAQRMADCHPNLPHQAKGLCSTCYMREWSRSHPERMAERRRNLPASDCHPDKPVRARGMCDRCYRRWWRDQNRERDRDNGADWQRARYQQGDEEYRRTRILKRYGMTPADFDQMLANQGGGCAVCGSQPAEGRRLQVDHCHETGRIRGLLCANCNSALGHAKDDVTRLRALIAYVEGASSAGTVSAGATPGG